MRTAVSFACIGVLALTLSGRGWGWSEATHQQLSSDALGSVKWLDGYQNLKVTPFNTMLKAVLGQAKPVAPDAFNFKKNATRQEKHGSYMASTASIEDPTVQKFARHLLLSNQIKVGYALGEQARPVSARQVLAGYSSEPDWGMDKGLDASRHQGLMGGTDPKQTSSQGFRHMSFLMGTMGETPARAQLFFDLGAKAIQKGHPYWGFRFVAWGMHYLEDMGAPVHTNMLPTLKYIRLKGMFRPRGQDGKRHFNKKVIGDVVKGSAQINANYHFLYEHYVDKVYTAKDKQARALSAAVQGRPGKQPGWLGRLLAPRSVKQVAKRRAWSRLSTPGIARNAIRLFTGIFRQAEPGAAGNTVRSVNEGIVKDTVATVQQRSGGESQRMHAFRQRSGSSMMRRTQGQFGKTGVALRQAINLLGKQVSTR